MLCIIILQVWVLPSGNTLLRLLAQDSLVFKTTQSAMRIDEKEKNQTYEHCSVQDSVLANPSSVLV